MALPELDLLAKELPEQDGKGRFFWQDYVDRLIDRFDGLPAPDGGDSFVQACLATGCQAVPVMRRNRLWEQNAPPRAHRRRPLYEMRIRLGLFFAASLRDLLHGVCRLRVRAGREEWHVLDGERQSYREFVNTHDGKTPDINWSKARPRYGQIYTLAPFFFQRKDILVLTRQVAEEVLEYARPGDPGGLFGRMLRQGEQEDAAMDIARVFLEALVEAVNQGVLRVNSRINGHLFVTPGLWLLSTPLGLDLVTEMLRARGPRYDFTRHDVYHALREADCLAGASGGTPGFDTAHCVLRSRAWSRPLQLHGLCILPGALPGQPEVPDFGGTVTLKKENPSGIDTVGIDAH